MDASWTKLGRFPRALLGHRIIQNTLRYIHMEQAIFKESDDKFHVKVAETLDEATKLLEVGLRVRYRYGRTKAVQEAQVTMLSSSGFTFLATDK